MTSADDALWSTLRHELSRLDIRDADHRFASAEPLARKRRRGKRAVADDPVDTVALIEHEGVLRFELGADAYDPGLRRGRRGGVGVGGSVISDFTFERLPPNQIGVYLQRLDERLSLVPGLRRWRNGASSGVKVPGKGKLLLFVHGTFSHGDHLLRELLATPAGAQFLRDAEGVYQQVLSFEHHTLAPSPLLNAIDLARAFAGSQADIDIVCHSRGGLVARWWLDALDVDAKGQRRVVFVGTPLAGTSLAAGPRLRAALDMLANVFRVATDVADWATVAAPPIAVLAGLLRVFTSIVRAGASLPVCDAAVAMIPGLAGQARVGNNHELMRLRAGARPDIARYAVRADFEPTDPGWRFWRHFVGWKERAADLGADLVFDAANDLVVDTESMTSVTDASGVPDDAEHLLDFGRTAVAHHLNYFRQAETLAFLRRVLLPS